MGYKFSRCGDGSCPCEDAEDCTLANPAFTFTKSSSYDGMYVVKGQTVGVDACTDFTGAIEWLFLISARDATHITLTRTDQGDGRSAEIIVLLSDGKCDRMEFNVGSSSFIFNRVDSSTMEKDTDSTCTGCLTYAGNGGYVCRASLGDFTATVAFTNPGTRPCAGPTIDCADAYDLSGSETFTPSDADAWDGYCFGSGGIPLIASTGVTCGIGHLSSTALFTNCLTYVFRMTGVTVKIWEYDMDVDGPRNIFSPITSLPETFDNNGENGAGRCAGTTINISY